MTEGHDLIGRQIGVYQILALLGRGGMGEVYRARDTRLGREVAIKVLPPAVAHDHARLARFEREAQVLASLNDPHIAAIHGFEEFDGTRALVLELVEGPTLAEVIASGPIAVREALTIARQITEALASAHERGIVHRDLKPANVKLRPDGRVKVLDFGLAKATAIVGIDSSQTTMPTRAGTVDGVVVGTVAYMSPEQARGKPVDKRTDIWAFGCVLFEMLTGVAVFHGETGADSMAAILHREPDWSLLPLATPASIRRLLQRCLQKDLTQRLHDVGDARIEIEEALAPSGITALAEVVPAAPVAPPSKRGVWLPWAIAALTASAAIAIAVIAFARRPTAASSTIEVRRLTDLVGLEETPALSPDGKTVAFVAMSGGKRHIWVRLLAGGAPLVITKDDLDHYSPRWAPDAATLIYYTAGSQPGQPGTIWEIPALGGSPRRVAEALGPGDISHDGKRIAFVRFRSGTPEFVTIARDGSVAESIVSLPMAPYDSLRWSNDDAQVAMLSDGVGSSFSASIVVIGVVKKTVRRVPGQFLYAGLSWAPDDSSVIVSSSEGSNMSYPPSFNLWRIPLDGAPPSQYTFGEASYEYPDVDRSGAVVVSRVRTQSDVWKLPVSGAPAENARGVRITHQTGIVQTASASPDEADVAVLADNGGHANVWIVSTVTGEMRPLTQEGDPRVVVAVPVWSPSSDWITFLSNRAAPGKDVSIWMARPDGSGARDLGLIGAWACWAPDGQWVYFSQFERETYRIKKVRVDGGDVVTVRDDGAVGCQLSADGSTMYYAHPLASGTGGLDWELRRASPEGGPSVAIGQVAGARVPARALNFHALLSPDGSTLAMPLIDGSTTNIWALSTTGGGWRKLTDFGERNVVIARRFAWSKDGRSIYASVSDVDSDVVMLTGLIGR